MKGNSGDFCRKKVNTGQKCAGQRGGGMDGQGKGKGADRFLHREGSAGDGRQSPASRQCALPE